ncbi:MAG: peptidoglycan-associated lipoprotein Pal [Polaromonas sp.]|jgi:peptidoglycan-associated lipoprotein
MKRISSVLSVLTLSFVLAACGSNVKLSDVPVEDRSAVVAGASGAGAGGATGSGVAPVEIMTTDTTAAGPVGAERVFYFDYDSFTIKPEFQRAIEMHARFLATNKSRRIAIDGHTDERGGREYNLALGQKRSEAVRRSLSLLGVSETQVEAVSFGEEKPAVAGLTEEAFAKNRRVEITYR